MWRDGGKGAPVRHPSQAGDVAVQRPCGLVTGGAGGRTGARTVAGTLGQVGARESVGCGKS